MIGLLKAWNVLVHEAPETDTKSVQPNLVGKADFWPRGDFWHERVVYGRTRHQRLL